MEIEKKSICQQNVSFARLKFAAWRSAFISLYEHEMTVVIYFVYLRERIIPKTIILKL